jgi:hypothetical protein
LPPRWPLPLCARSGQLATAGQAPADVRADAAIADPAFSHGEFFVGPGTHATGFDNKALRSETSTGTGGYFRVDSRRR